MTEILNRSQQIALVKGKVTIGLTKETDSIEKITEDRQLSIVNGKYIIGLVKDTDENGTNLVSEDNILNISNREIIITVESGNATNDINLLTQENIINFESPEVNFNIEKTSTSVQLSVGAMITRMGPPGPPGPSGAGTPQLGVVLDAGMSSISSGGTYYVKIPFACTIDSWEVIADKTGNIVVDVWKSDFANFPPTIADSIAGTQFPSLVNQQKNLDVNLTTWDKNVIAGDWMAFHVDSADTVSYVVVTLQVTAT